MNLCRPGRDGAPVIYSGWGLVLNARWVQDLNKDNVPCLRSMRGTTPNPPDPLDPPGTAVFIKMVLFDPEVGLSIKGRNVAGRQGGGREIMTDNER
jgi:hypothetical protein